MPAIVGAIIAIASPVLNSQLAQRRERRQQLWQRELDVFLKLEALAGTLTDRLTGWALRPGDYDVVYAQIGELALMAGNFPRYPSVQKAIRDLHNTAGIMAVTKNEYATQGDREQTVAEMKDRCQTLLQECSHILGRES